MMITLKYYVNMHIAAAHDHLMSERILLTVVGSSEHYISLIVGFHHVCRLWTSPKTFSQV